MPTYQVYLNHVDRAYAMYEQGTSRTLEWRGPYSDAYYETSCSETDLVAEAAPGLCYNRGKDGEPLLTWDGGATYWRPQEFEGAAQAGLLTIRRRTRADKPIDLLAHWGAAMTRVAASMHGSTDIGRSDMVAGAAERAVAPLRQSKRCASLFEERLTPMNLGPEGACRPRKPE